MREVITHHSEQVEVAPMENVLVRAHAPPSGTSQRDRPKWRGVMAALMHGGQTAVVTVRSVRAERERSLGSSETATSRQR
jgi:hypothetical protein